MSPLLALGWLHYAFSIPLALLSIFLSLVILVQRGRGGGLTGALGGMGGQSAFGTKAGDLFTRITIVVAALWILLSMAALKVLNQQSSTGGLSAGAKAPVSAPDAPGTSTPGSSAPGSTAPGTTAPGSTTPSTPAPGTSSPAPESGSGSGASSTPAPATPNE